jgi:hypothetical protein
MRGFSSNTGLQYVSRRAWRIGVGDHFGWASATIFREFGVGGCAHRIGTFVSPWLEGIGLRSDRW